jgi:hypothetical protein
MTQPQCFIDIFRWNSCSCWMQLLQMFDETSAVVCPKNCRFSPRQLQFFASTSAVVQPNNCSCFAGQWQLFEKLCDQTKTCDYSMKQLQLCGETIAVVRWWWTVWWNNCSCSINQLQFFVELFDEPTAVVICNNCGRSVQLLPVFDKTCVVVCSNDCNCSLQQLQLVDQPTAVIPWIVAMKQLQMFGAKTAVVQSAVQWNPAVVRRTNCSCRCSMNCSITQWQVFDRATVVFLCNYCISSIEQPQFCDLAAAVVRPTNCSCSIKQLQL